MKINQTIPSVVKASNKPYKIDWNKINSLEDLKFIIQNINIEFNESHSNFEELKKYLIL